MIILLSPAKRQARDAAKPLGPDCGLRRRPRFLAESERLRRHLEQLGEGELAQLFGLSEAKAQELYRTYHGAAPQLPSLELFQGPAYKALIGDGLPEALCDPLDNSLRILSGLYGYLSPFDAVRPYRLDVADKLPGFESPDLYRFWRPRITEALREELSDRPAPLLLDLASKEYSSTVDHAALREAGVEIVRPEFGTLRGGAEKRVSVHAKQGRGALARKLLDASAERGDERWSRERLDALLGSVRFDGYSLDRREAGVPVFVKRE